MYSVWLIARREFLERVRTKAFLVSLILFPLIMAGMIALPSYFAEHLAGHKRIAVVTPDRLLGQLFAQELRLGSDGVKFDLTLTAPEAGLQKKLETSVEHGQMDGFLWLGTPDNPRQARYFANSASDLELSPMLEAALQHAEAREQLMAWGMSPRAIQALFGPVHVDTRKLQGANASTDSGTEFSAIILMFMLTGSVMGQGFAVSRSVIEEKTSRIFEVMLSSVTPDQMLGGKLIGVAAVGLTQLAVWLSVGELVAGPSAAAAHSSGQFELHLTLWNMVAFVVCFLLGFLFYSALSAMLGSMVNSDQELQQISLFITLPLFFCFALFQPIVADPSGKLAVILSLLPPFAPLLMYLRIALKTPPMWQIGLSLVLTTGGVWLAIWIASRIYRVGVLMYGKRPTLPELMRWLRYS